MAAAAADKYLWQLLALRNVPRIVSRRRDRQRSECIMIDRSTVYTIDICTVNKYKQDTRHKNRRRLSWCYILCSQRTLAESILPVLNVSVPVRFQIRPWRQLQHFVPGTRARSILSICNLHHRPLKSCIAAKETNERNNNTHKLSNYLSGNDTGVSVSETKGERLAKNDRI